VVEVATPTGSSMSDFALLIQQTPMRSVIGLRRAIDLTSVNENATEAAPSQRLVVRERVIHSNLPQATGPFENLDGTFK
jgi:hypothetical protein